jgi:hypothetical protein
MEPRRSAQSTREDSEQSPFFLAIAGLVEVVVACLMIVGVFAAASQEFGWSSALQMGACGLLGGLLWYADRTLIVEPAKSERASLDYSH